MNGIIVFGKETFLVNSPSHFAKCGFGSPLSPWRLPPFFAQVFNVVNGSGPYNKSGATGFRGSPAGLDFMCIFLSLLFDYWQGDAVCDCMEMTRTGAVSPNAKSRIKSNLQEISRSLDKAH
jgi:hypothetical protein